MRLPFLLLPFLRLPFLFLPLLLIGLPAQAQVATPRSIADCERIKGDLAYNQCLSMFGPAAKGAVADGGRAAPAAAAATAAAEPAGKEKPRYSRYRGRRGYASARGRQRGSFSVMSGTRKSWRKSRRRH